MKHRSNDAAHHRATAAEGEAGIGVGRTTAPVLPRAWCSRCGVFPRIDGQRWCRRCFTAYMREWRKRQRAELLELRAR